MDERDKAIVIALAENNMNATQVAMALFMHRNTVLYHTNKVKKLTGLDPHNFYDLHKLVNLATGKDVAEVVRCKDCKHWKPGDSMMGNSIDDMQIVGGCPYVRFRRLEDEFCSYGERKTDGKG